MRPGLSPYSPLSQECISTGTDGTGSSSTAGRPGTPGQGLGVDSFCGRYKKGCFQADLGFVVGSMLLHEQGPHNLGRGAFVPNSDPILEF